MKLYIRQKVFSWTDRFTVRDGDGRDRYTVEGELFSWGKKLHVLDASGREAAFIREKVWSFLPRYYVSVGGREIAEIVREGSFFRPRYHLEGLPWVIDGSFWEHDYEIRENGRLIVTIHKEWMTWGDCYELDIADARDEIPALAVVLTIDCVMAAAAAAASN